MNFYLKSCIWHGWSLWGGKGVGGSRNRRNGKRRRKLSYRTTFAFNRQKLKLGIKKREVHARDLSVGTSPTGVILATICNSVVTKPNITKFIMWFCSTSVTFVFLIFGPHFMPNSTLKVETNNNFIFFL